MSETIQVLDAGFRYWHNGEIVAFGYLGLLDGKGAPLPFDGDPVWLSVNSDDLANGVARNSAGDVFDATPIADEPTVITETPCA